MIFFSSEMLAEQFANTDFILTPFKKDFLAQNNDHKIDLILRFVNICQGRPIIVSKRRKTTISHSR